MPSVKAGRNKTIDITVEDGCQYLERCIEIDNATQLADIIDKTILGDCLSIMPHLPSGFVDLLIADPPYNLNKDFNGKNHIYKFVTTNHNYQPA